MKDREQTPLIYKFFKNIWRYFDNLYCLLFWLKHEVDWRAIYRKMTEAQFGNYTCVATNLYGRGEATLTVTGVQRESPRFQSSKTWSSAWMFFLNKKVWYGVDVNLELLNNKLKNFEKHFRSKLLEIRPVGSVSNIHA